MGSLTHRRGEKRFGAEKEQPILLSSRKKRGEMQEENSLREARESEGEKKASEFP